MVQRKHQRQTAQRLLPPTEVRDILPALLRRHDAEQDPFGEGIQTVDQLQLRVAAHGDHLVHFLEAQRDGAKARHEAFEAERAQVVVPLLGGVAGGEGGGQIGGAGGVFVDAPAVFGQDGEVDGGGLRAFFERGDGGFEQGFVQVGELVFGVGWEVVGGLVGVFAEVAGTCQCGLVD